MLKAIILAAGSGSRLAPLGLTTPKLLIPILNRPLLDHHIAAIQPLVDEAIIVISPDHLGQQITTYITSHSWPIRLTLATQDQPHGTAHAYQAAQPYLKTADKLLCLNGDDLYAPSNLAELVHHPYAILGQPVDDWDKWGILQPNTNNTLAKLIEKPNHYVGNLANTGAYLLDASIFDLFHQLQPSIRGEYEFTDTVSLFAQAHPVSVVAVQNYWLPIGYPWHILDAHEKLAANHTFTNNGTIESNVTIQGHLSLGHNSLIKSGTYLEGDIIIGDNCLIGPNAYLRGITVIGNNCHIGAGVELKNSTLFSHTKIPHLSYIGDSILGHHVTIGTGSHTAANSQTQTVKTQVKGILVDTGRHQFGTVIGDYTSLSTSTLISPGRKIWPNLTTSPGEIITTDKTA